MFQAPQFKKFLPFAKKFHFKNPQYQFTDEKISTFLLNHFFILTFRAIAYFHTFNRYGAGWRCH